MNSALRQDIIEWDVLNWAQALKVWQPIINSLQPGSKILAVGERNGGLSLWLALQGFNVECTDRQNPAEHATPLHNKYNVSHKINYGILDIVNDTLPQAQYDLVIMKSVLGGLKEDYTNAASRSTSARDKAIHNIYRSLCPGGYLLSADNMLGSAPIRYFRTLKNKDKGWYYFSLPALKQAFSPFPSAQIATSGILPTVFKSTLINRVIYFVNKYLLSFMPANTCYIAITSARKPL